MLDQVSYQRIRSELTRMTGIELGANRQTLVHSRLFKRLEITKTHTYSVYLNFLFSGSVEAEAELLIFVDLLSTNETYFYREPQHFNFFRQLILPNFRNKPFRVLSAACSSGEEAYSLAFEAADILGLNSDWTISGMDISTGIVENAKEGIYEESRAKRVPEHLKRRFLRKGVNAMAGQCRVVNDIREHTSFYKGNLLERKSCTSYDVIFCRNVLFYFDAEKQQATVRNLYDQLNPGGYLFVSRTEQLRRWLDGDLIIQSSIAQKPE